METARTYQRQINRLDHIRNRFDAASSREKLDLLRSLDGVGVGTSGGLERLHAALCFIRAFPDTLDHYRCARAQLASFEERIASLPATTRDALWDTGIAGTQLNYRFSYEVAVWLAKRAPGAVSIDWEEIDDPSRLDDLLALLIQGCEADHFDSGAISCREWFEQAVAGTARTDFDWLLAHMGEERLSSIWTHMYNAVELPLTWQLTGAGNSTTLNTIPVRRVSPRSGGMRKRVRSPKQEIMRPLKSLRKLSPRAGRRMVDVAMTSLAVRHRETYHFSYANPGDIHVADVGEGVSIAVFGMREKHRYPLESTMGYLILSNGVPVGYGGASALFRQVNTGVNFFEEYRGSEAAFLWVQVMRVYRQLVGCSRFIANPYQFGSENPEALHSGAFWFYYRLGFRPTSPAVQKLAKRELARLDRNGSRRSDLKTLERLASCDMHLTLPGARAGELFDETWIETSSMLASRILSAAGGRTSDEAANRVGAKLARDVGLRDVGRWSTSRRRAYLQLAPIVAATRPAHWPAEAKRSIRALLRAKGGPDEADYARLLARHEYFLRALRKICRKAA